MLNDVHALRFIALLPEDRALLEVDGLEVGRDLEPEVLRQVGKGREGLYEQRQRRSEGRPVGLDLGGGQVVVLGCGRVGVVRVRDDRLVSGFGEVPASRRVLVRLAERKVRSDLRDREIDRRRFLLALRCGVEGSPESRVKATRSVTETAGRC